MMRRRRKRKKRRRKRSVAHEDYGEDCDVNEDKIMK